MILLCQHCGASPTENPYGAFNARCSDCGLVPDVGGAWEGSFDPEDEILYRLDAWPAGDRLALGLALCDHDVPFKWEPGPVLVVRQEGQAVVEAFLDEMDAAGADGGSDDAWLENAEVDPAVESALGDLFDAADRLMHAPWDVGRLAQVSELTRLVGTSDPPFGIEQRTWEAVAAQSAAVVEAGDQEDVELVAERARALRALIREFV
jgi:hypothetical protein